MVNKKVHTASPGQARAFVRNEWIDHKNSVCGVTTSWGI
jgi:hypothetical protein